MKISERILKMIEERGMTQKEFSRRTGISQSTISDWKTKKTNPASDKIMTICEVLSVTPYELLQDTVKQGAGGRSDKPQQGYMAVSAGTDKYEILLKYDKLDFKQRERLKGYLSALVEQ